MIEKIVLDYLTEHMSVPVFMELPETPSTEYPTMPERFLLLEKVGGGQTDHIDSGSVPSPCSLIHLTCSMRRLVLMRKCGR